MKNNNYEFEGVWLKGNLHTHTENSPCGHYPIEKVIEMYTSYKMKYDFIAITDHYNITELDNYLDDENIILFHGVEFKEKYSQTLGINIKSHNDDLKNIENHQELFKQVVDQGGFNIICHPHMNTDDYWSFEKLKNLDNFVGIEVFNNNMKHDNSGRAVATDLWDELLTSGKRVFGFANDDMHIFSRAGCAFNMVLAKERTREAIIEGITSGRFYCSSGVFIDRINVNNNKITVSVLKVPGTFRFIGRNGFIHHEGYGMEASYSCSGDEGYIRVEVLREDGARAWLQPFFL